MEILFSQWWLLGFIGVSILFFSFIIIYLYSRRIDKKIKTYYTYIVDIPNSDGTVAMTTMIGEDESSNSYTHQYYLIDKLMSKIFITIPISCAILYFISNIPGLTSPSWFNIILQIITYGSAGIYYFFIKKEDV